MISKRVTIKNPTGLHLRPAGLFCKMALDMKVRSLFITGYGREREKCSEHYFGACIRSPEIRLRSCVRKKTKKLEAIVELVGRI